MSPTRPFPNRGLRPKALGRGERRGGPTPPHPEAAASRRRPPPSEFLEVARGRADVQVRDITAVTGSAVVFSPEGWSAFVTAIRSGELCV